MFFYNVLIIFFLDSIFIVYKNLISDSMLNGVGLIASQTAVRSIIHISLLINSDELQIVHSIFSV